MKAQLPQLAVAFIGSFVFQATATTRYVDLNCSNSTPPYASWATAATNIQEAVDAADPGDEILVTNGVYQTGGVVVSPGLLTNRIALTKAVVVRSVNGPAAAVIQGHQVPGTIRGTNAIRCAYLSNGATLEGFTLANGATFSSGNSTNSINYSGGGVWCESTNAAVMNCVFIGNSAALGGGVFSGTLSNCVLQTNAAGTGGGAHSSVLLDCRLTGNVAGGGGGAYASLLVNCELVGNRAVFEAGSANGGGVHGGTIRNSVLTGNTAGNHGGGAYGATLDNCLFHGNHAGFGGGGASICNLDSCTVVGNSANDSGGGSRFSTLINCIVYYNSAPLAPDLDSGAIANCCSPPGGGAGSIRAEPELASLSHLSDSSPCRAAGNAAYADGVDIDGEFWAKPPSIGCDQFNSGSVTGAVTVVTGVSHTNVAVASEVRFTALIEGRVSNSRWEFGDGTIVSNRPFGRHRFMTVGNYSVILRAFNESYPDGVTSTTVVQVVAQPVHYVRASNPGQAFPYTSWATAATSIQQAVDAATVPGSLVLVSNGLYGAGGRYFAGVTNRLVVTNPIIVRSVNGPASTTIRGIGPVGFNTIRCVFLGDGATLDGFTLTNGATGYASGGISRTVYSGGGVFCASSATIVTNCVLAGNSAGLGGGMFGGTLYDSRVINNSAQAGGGIAADHTVVVQCWRRSTTARSWGIPPVLPVEVWLSVHSQTVSYISTKALTPVTGTTQTMPVRVSRLH